MTIILSHLVVPFFFLLHLTVLSSYYVVLTSHVTVLLSHSVVHLFFSHIWWIDCHIRQYQHHVWLYFCHIRWYPFFFLLTFNSSVITLGNNNITCDHTFVTFNGSLVFCFFFYYYYLLITFDSSIIILSHTNITNGGSQPNPTPPNYLIIDEYIYIYIKQKYS